MDVPHRSGPWPPLNPFQSEMTRASLQAQWSFALPNLRNHFGGFLEGVVCGRHSTIDRLLQDDFLDFVRRESSLGERRSHMHAELFPFIQGEHRADNQDATRALVVMGTGPNLAPGHACYEILKFLIEGSFPRVRAVDPFIAEHLAAPGHAALVALLVVHSCSFGRSYPRRKLSTVSLYCFGCSTLEMCAASRLASLAPLIAF